MGLRSDFARIGHDKYKTPPEAVLPLLPHLPPNVRYAEPCAADGQLIAHLRPHATLAWACDIEPEVDWIPYGDALTCRLGDAEMFLTNPPWTRAILHPLIVHLSDQAPTWLLFDSAWANTKQARPFMERCRRIVAAGRFKWIPGTKWTGKEDASWFCFDRPIAGSAPIFYGRGCLPPEAKRRPRRVCHDCGVMIDRFGKWRLQIRNGTLTVVHVDCADPSGTMNQEPAVAPLFDAIPRQSDAANWVRGERT